VIELTDTQLLSLDLSFTKFTNPMVYSSQE
jgi:hypothetical protein